MTLFTHFLIVAIRALFPKVAADVPLFTVLANAEITPLVDEFIRILVRDLKGIVLIADGTPVGKRAARWCDEYDINHCVRGWSDTPEIKPGWKTGQHQRRIRQAERANIFLADTVYVMLEKDGYDDHLREMVDYARKYS